ncbi:MAG: lipocalin family protein [Gemmataceae bacterium]|nr:lipocalin family protein [Gemmataceae bacterium]
MRLRWALLWVLLVALVPQLNADDKKAEEKDAPKDNISAKLEGTWEIVKATDQEAVGAVVTFKKEGKFTFVIKIEGQEFKVDGTYKIEDGKLHTTANVNGQEESDVDTFKKLTDDEIELENKEGKVTVLKRKKD